MTNLNTEDADSSSLNIEQMNAPPIERLSRRYWKSNSWLGKKKLSTEALPLPNTSTPEKNDSYDYVAEISRNKNRDEKRRM